MTDTGQDDPALARAIASHLNDSSHSVLLLSGAGLFEYRRDKFGILKRRPLTATCAEVSR